MLRALTIRDIILIEDVTIELAPGLNVVTGETGAGKSALVGALSLLLGGKGGRDWLRTGARSAQVEAAFDMPDDPAVAALLDEAGIEPADEIILRRRLDADGRSRAFVNAVGVPLKLTRQIGERLLSVTSQHEHVQLLDDRRHVDYLDAFGGLQEEAADYRACHDEWRQIQARIAELEEAARERRDRLELLRFQAAEIDGVEPRTGEVEALEARHRRLQSAEELRLILRELVYGLYEEEGAVHERLGGLSQVLARGVAIDDRLSEPAARLHGLRDELQELALELERAADGVESDEEALAEVEARLDALNGLCYKYGRTLDHVLEERARIGREIEAIDMDDQQQGELHERRDALGAQVEARALSLSRGRVEAAARLEREVGDALARLQMPGVRFEALMTPCEPGPRGAERVGFAVETNPGEGARPMAAIVSGGELSRILLALKRALLYADPVPLHVFDEIDAGLSQAVSLKVGGLLDEVSQAAQILVITHQPHIARFAGHHLVVDKQSVGERNVTRVRALSAQARVDELARMLGGEEAGLPVMQQAELMLKTP
jgi:DNA repair protein RecN (Recombination protein N)